MILTTNGKDGDSKTGCLFSKLRGRQWLFYSGNRYIAYCGRINSHWGLVESPLANPIRICRTVSRESCISAFRKQLWEEFKLLKVGEPPSERVRAVQQLAEIHRAGIDIQLVCWCLPKPCHITVIKSSIEWCSLGIIK